MSAGWTRGSMRGHGFERFEVLSEGDGPHDCAPLPTPAECESRDLRLNAFIRCHVCQRVWRLTSLGSWVVASA